MHSSVRRGKDHGAGYPAYRSFKSRRNLIGDLNQQPNNLPSSRFDCIVSTHVLHVVTPVRRAVAELSRLLKPDGVLLVAVPGVSMCGDGFHELWRFTPEGLELLLAETFGGPNVTVRGYGNSLTAAAELRGLVADEFTPDELDYSDACFPVEVCARAVKYAASVHYTPTSSQVIAR